ncbi:glycosyltransferase [Brachyspira hyodysenteriae]|uniref:glycosyltransferase n=1 Tax=Brachyspira hyodysenteriae TaxID=159 RepID=UPI0011836BA5|nr:glycosyltransferase [Brachyspira hyodysenteriae]TVL55630.1 glycosyltransferase [Brachyspira hyodysenteriae]
MLKFTIIIPHRVGENIEKTLEGVYLSNYPKENIEIFQAEGTHPTVQRNECIKQSLGDIIYFIDNDSVVSPDNIKEAGIIFESDEKIAIVGGPAVHQVNSLVEMYIDRCMRAYYAVGPIANRYRFDNNDVKEGSDRDVILCNLFVRRNVLFEAGLFNENLYPNEENALIDKILSLGYKLIYNPKIIVQRPPRSNLKSYIKMLLNYGRGRFEQLFRDFNIKNLIFILPSLFANYVILTPIVLCAYHFSQLSVLKFYFLPLLVYIIMTSLAGILYSFSDKGIISKIRGIFVYPFMFFITHFFYGLGFFYGIIRIMTKFKRVANFSVKKYKSFE